MQKLFCDHAIRFENNTSYRVLHRGIRWAESISAQLRSLTCALFAGGERTREDTQPT
jgi:hypothetical protein